MIIDTPFEGYYLKKVHLFNDNRYCDSCNHKWKLFMRTPEMPAGEACKSGNPKTHYSPGGGRGAGGLRSQSFASEAENLTELTWLPNETFRQL